MSCPVSEAAQWEINWILEEGWKPAEKNPAVEIGMELSATLQSLEIGTKAASTALSKCHKARLMKLGICLIIAAGLRS